VNSRSKWSTPDGRGTAPGVLDRLTQRFDVGGVAGQLLGAVLEDCDGGTGRGERGALQSPSSGSPPAGQSRHRSRNDAILSHINRGE
jgi:hypothetical protein